MKRPTNDAASKWLASIFSSQDEIQQKEVAERLAEHLRNKPSPSRINKLAGGTQKFKIEELDFFEQLFGERFPPPWDLRRSELASQATTQSNEIGYAFLAEDPLKWEEETRLSPPPRSGLLRLSVSNDEAQPIYRRGDTIWVDPWRQIKAKDDVYVELIDCETRKKTLPGIIRHCIAAGPDRFILSRWTTSTEENHDRCDVALVYSIVIKELAQN